MSLRRRVETLMLSGKVIRPLFIIGNKRSGTSQLVRVLNLHPRVFVSHESDIAWILYQFHNRQTYRAHEWDSERGMRETLKVAESLLRSEVSPMENFVAVQTAIMRAGNPWLPAQDKPDLCWMGDKKPKQHTDPALLKFIGEHFPAAKFLHIVRHPFQVVTSSDRFNKTVNGDFWLGLSPEEKVERWTFHEQRVLDLKEEQPENVHSLRYEDFCSDTEKELRAILEFLEVDVEPELLREAARQTQPLVRAVPQIRCSDETRRIAAHYGYDVDGGTSRFRAWTRTVYKRTAKKLIRSHASGCF